MLTSGCMKTESLDTLKQWVMESFGNVREGGETSLRFPWEGPVWESGHMYHVESVKDQHLIALTWPFPCLESAYLKKPQDYISHLLGHGNLKRAIFICYDRQGHDNLFIIFNALNIAANRFLVYN